MVATKDASAPLVVVIGATGNQGGSVIKALLESDRQYRLRALTRDASKPAAKDLAAKGAEVHAVTISAGAHAEVAEAFAGATYVFGVTDFWAHLDKQREIDEGKVIVDAAKEVGATLIWSGLESCAAASTGKYEAVDHFEGKYQVTQYAKSQGAPTIVVQPGFFASNFLDPQLGPRKTPDGKYVCASSLRADTLAPIVDIPNDYGLFVRAAIEGPYEPGDELLSVGEWITYGDAVKTIAEVTGKPVVYHGLSDDDLRGALAQSQAPPRVQLEVLEMFAYHRDCGYYAGKPTDASTAHLARKPATFREWAQKADWSQVLS